MGKAKKKPDLSQTPGAPGIAAATYIDPSVVSGVMAAMILLCAFLLRLPGAVSVGSQRLSWLEAIFTATSAVTLTGLTLRDTASQFSPFGQAVIAAFIQVSGLAIATLAAWLIIGPGRRRLQDLAKFVTVTALALELAGACAMYPLWKGGGGGLSAGQRAGLSAFHAVTAFCNGGFSNLSGSLEDYRYSELAHLVVVPLIVLGSIGLPVLADCWSRLRGPKADWLSRRSKIALATTGGLYLAGVTLFMATQLMPYVYDYYHMNITAHQRKPEPLSAPRLGAMLADSSFLAVTSRTAGLHTMPMDQLGQAGHVSLIVLMFIGGSPGSAAGGIKTTTLAILLLSVLATLRGRPGSAGAEAFGKRLDDATVRGALALAGVMIGLVVAGTLLLCLMEPVPFIKAAFETVSAASNTGLSLGITGDLSSFSKGVIVVMMFMGRLLPATLAALGVGAIDS